jgi:predicted amidophosphoribosyltransferase
MKIIKCTICGEDFEPAGDEDICDDCFNELKEL